MAKVDPQTHQPQSDAPEGDDDTRGSRKLGDPTLDDATQTGGKKGMTTGQHDGANADKGGPLPGERPSRGETGSDQ